MNGKPRRRKLGDRITGTTDPRQIEVDFAIAPLDQMARSMDAKWGTDRLPELVSPELARRYGSAIAKLNAAIDAGDPAEAEKQAGSCMRGLEKLDQEATASGAKPLPPDVMTLDRDGQSIGIIRDWSYSDAVEAVWPGLKLYTLEEVAAALRHLDHKLIDAARDAFPGAQVVSITKRKGPVPDDEIPF